MKTKIFIFLTLLLCLSSCAEEGPITMGKFECEIEVPLVTQKGAVIKITIPESKNNILTKSFLHLYLYDKPLRPSEDYEDWDYVWSNNVVTDYYEEDNNTIYFLPSNLKSGKTYYMLFRDDMHLNGKKDYTGSTYYPEISFTTLSEDDYLTVNLTCELMEVAPNGNVNVRFKLPQNIRIEYINRIIASKFADMSQPIVGFDRYGEYKGKQIFDVWLWGDNLEKTKYYLQIIGNFSYQVAENVKVPLNDCVFNVSNTLDLSGL